MEGKYRQEYTYHHSYPHHRRHVWVVECAHGALHLHITDLGPEKEDQMWDRYSGGIEIHYRTPPDYKKDDAPSQSKCWALGGTCWHDGSSLQASERWIPMWRQDPNDHDGMFRALSRDMESRFGIERDTP